MLVYQMGKVASQSISKSLTAAGVYNYQIHFLSREGMRTAEQVYRKNWIAGRGGAKHLWQSQVVSRWLASGTSGRWKVITVVRDPVARNISSYFQIAELEYGIDLSATSAADAAGLAERFLEEFHGHDLPLRWLDDELRAVLGVDVLSEPFSSSGYAVYSGRHADVLLLRFEDLGRVFAPAVSAFLGTPVTMSIAANTSDSKRYGDLYAQTRQRLALPPEYLDRMYDSPYCRHFWSDEELRRMRERWDSGD